MRYLVTGGLGFVGSWVTRHLALAGHDVFVLSRGERAPDLGAPYTLVQADITAGSAALGAALPPDLDGCVHAASFNEADAPDYGRLALSVNALGTGNLLEALADAADAARKTPCPVVYLSTVHVYGKADGAITEETPAAPRNEYALTHLLGEEYGRFFQRVRGVPVLTARLSNGYGSPLVAPFGKWYLLLPDLCRMAFRERRIRLRSPGGIRRDWIWLGDVAAALAFLLEELGRRPDLGGRVVNIASGQTPSIAELAELAAAVYARRYAQAAAVELAGGSGGGEGPFISTETLRALRPGFAPGNRLAEEMDATFAFLEKHKGKA